MFFVLLRADRYAGILETDSGFELFPINGALQLQKKDLILGETDKFFSYITSRTNGDVVG